jgi:broad specificity phosphatase PhoE
MLRPVPFYYLRHGQTDWNLEHRAQGQQDVELNHTGRMQAVQAVTKLRGKGIASICCSPLSRARESASIIGLALSLPVVVIDDLKEAAWGVFEGQAKGPWFNLWKDGKTHEGAEPYEAFLHRALRGINLALQEQAPVLIVAHGGTYWSVEKHSRISLTEDIPNCTPVFHQPPPLGQAAWLVEAIS